MKRILVFLPKGFELLEASAFTDVAGWARVVEKKDIFTCLCGLTKEINASFGTDKESNIIKANLLLNEVDPSEFDALAIPGGFGQYGYFEDGFDKRVLKMIQEFEKRGKPIAAVCTASIILGMSGILKTRTATTYRFDNGKYIRQLENFCANVSDEDVVVCDKVITSCGPSSAPFVALKLIGMLTSDEIAKEVATVMGYDTFNIGKAKKE